MPLEYYLKHTDTTLSDIIALVNVDATRDWYEDANTTDTSKEYAILVNKTFLIFNR